MIVLDSYAVLALLKGAAGATAVRRLLQGNEPVQLTTLFLEPMRGEGANTAYWSRSSRV